MKCYLADHGISQWRSCPYTSEQNGCANRKHHHIVETGLALLDHANLPMQFWDYTFDVVVYMINRLPTPYLGHLLSYQKLFCEKSNYTQLKIFYCAFSS